MPNACDVRWSATNMSTCFDASFAFDNHSISTDITTNLHDYHKPAPAYLTYRMPISADIPYIAAACMIAWSFIAYTLWHKRSVEDEESERQRLMLAHDRLA